MRYVQLPLFVNAVPVLSDQLRQSGETGERGACGSNGEDVLQIGALFVHKETTPSLIWAISDKDRRRTTVAVRLWGNQAKE
jgi:hypothetical protein